MHEKGEFSKIKEGIWNIPREAANIFNVSPRLAGSNRLLLLN